MCKYKLPCGLCELTKCKCSSDDVSATNGNKEESKKLELLLEDLLSLKDASENPPAAVLTAIDNNYLV